MTASVTWLISPVETSYPVPAPASGAKDQRVLIPSMVFRGAARLARRRCRCSRRPPTPISRSAGACSASANDRARAEVGDADASLLLRRRSRHELTASASRGARQSAEALPAARPPPAAIGDRRSAMEDAETVERCDGGYVCLRGSQVSLGTPAPTSLSECM